MKRTLYSICIGAVALSLATVQGEDNNNNKGHRATVRSGGTTTSARVTAHNTGVKSSATLRQNTPRVTARTYRSTTPKTFSGTATASRNHVYRSNPTVTTRSNVAVNRSRNLNTSNQVVMRDRNFRNSNAITTRDRTVVNNNRFVNSGNRNVVNRWNGSRFAGSNYAAFRNYHRQWHDRGWWRGHYNRILFVGGGWYYWNAGYWFPAWGYDPYYSYPYDGPIYGYNGMAPDQVIVDVQNQLQRDGYYNGPADGVLGPMTRQAIADFQADHGLAVTSAIDEPTLSTLGVS